MQDFHQLNTYPGTLTLTPTLTCGETVTELAPLVLTIEAAPDDGGAPAPVIMLYL